MDLCERIVGVVAGPPRIGILAPGHQVLIGDVGRIAVALRTLQRRVDERESPGLDRVAAGDRIGFDHEHAGAVAIRLERGGETGNARADYEDVRIGRGLGSPAAQ